MSIASVLGILASGATGYLQGKKELQDLDEREQQKRLREMQVQGAQLDLNRKQQEASDQNLIRSAGVDVKPTTDADGPMPEGQAFRVAGQGFGDAASANAAAGKMNTPEAKTARRLGVLRTINPEQADKEEKSAMDLTKYRHDFTKSLEDEGAMDFVSANMAQAPSVDDIKAKKAGDFALTGVDDFNKNGKVKIPAGAKGRWQVMTLPNGREVADFVVNDEKGQQFYPMSARTLQAIHGMTLHERENQADSQFTQGSTIKHQRTMEGIAQQHADSEERHWKDQMRLLSAKIAAGNGTAQPSLGIKDIRDFEEDANKRVTEIFQPKEGADANERAVLGAQRNAIVAKASTLFQVNAARGNPLTAGQILQALELEKDPKNVITMAGSDQNGYRLVNVNGTPVMVSAPLAKKQSTAVAGIDPAAGQAPQQQLQRPRTAAAGLPQGGPSGVDALRADPVWGGHVKALDQVAAQVATAKSQLAAAAKSGDAKVINQYAAQLQTARDTLKAQATKRLGTNAATYLQSLSDL